MDTNIQLLNYICQNSEMGKDATEHLIEACEDEYFKSILKKQFNEYKRVFDLAAQKLISADKSPEELSSLSKLSTDIALNLKTLRDKSPSHIAEMMIQGNTMGIIDMTKKLHEYNDASQSVLDLGQHLLKFQQDCIEELKRFLT